MKPCRVQPALFPSSEESPVVAKFRVGVVHAPDPMILERLGGVFPDVRRIFAACLFEAIKRQPDTMDALAKRLNEEWHNVRFTIGDLVRADLIHWEKLKSVDGVEWPVWQAKECDFSSGNVPNKTLK